MAQITHFLETLVEFTKETVVGRPEQSLQRGEGGYADWVLIAILCYREREEETYRSVVDKLKVMKEIRDLLGLSLSNLPHPSTVCRALERFSMSLFRQLLSKTLALFELGDVTAIDASGFDRIAASRRCEKRTGYRFLAMKTTAPDRLFQWSDSRHSLFDESATRHSLWLASAATKHRVNSYTNW